MFSVAFMVKRTFWAVCLCLTLILFPLPSYALTVQDVPNPRREYGGWVTDMAEILSPDTEAKLNQIIFQLERQNGDELAVVTVPETTPAPNPKAFTTELFNYWDIGKQEENNGVLFLVSKSDRHVEIRTGYALSPCCRTRKSATSSKKKLSLNSNRAILKTVSWRALNHW
jgi:uncharacterized protein